VTDKRFPILTGNGHSTLEELVWAHPRYRLQASEDPEIAKLMGVESQGMVLAASGDEGPGIFLVSPDAGARPGMRVK